MLHGTQQLPSEVSPDIEMIEEIERMPQAHSLSSQTNCDPKSNSKVEVTENSKPGTSKPKSCEKERTLTFHINHLNNEYKINLSEFSSLSKWLILYHIVCIQ